MSENSEYALEAFGDSAMYNSRPSYPAIKSNGMPKGATLSNALTRSCNLAISDSASRATSICDKASSIFDFIEITSFFTSAIDLGPSVFAALISDWSALALVKSWLVAADSSEEIDAPIPIPSSKLPYSSMCTHPRSAQTLRTSSSLSTGDATVNLDISAVSNIFDTYNEDIVLRI